MYKRILIATDGSAIGDKALAHGLALAQVHKAPVSIVTVTDMWSAFDMAHEAREGHKDPLGTYEAMAAEGARKVLAAAEGRAKDFGVDAALIHIRDKRPSEGILIAAEQSGADVIVMGSHGRRGIERLLIGSQANEVVTFTKVPVLIVR